jgi:hypothetical protein
MSGAQRVVFLFMLAVLSMECSAADMRGSNVRQSDWRLDTCIEKRFLRHSPGGEEFVIVSDENEVLASGGG